MKKNNFLLPLSCFLLLIFLYSCSGNTETTDYQIKGKLSNSSGEMMALIDMNTNQPKTIDSVIINENGEFVFTKKVSQKGFYNIQFSASNFATLILDSSEHALIEGDAQKLGETYKVSGSKDSEIFFSFNHTTKDKFKRMEIIKYRQDSIRQVFQSYLNATSDSVSVDSLSRTLEPTFNAFAEEMKKISDDVTAYSKKFIDENSGSFASLAAIQMLNPEKNISYYVKIADALSAKYPDVAKLKEFKSYVDEMKNSAVGMPAPEITMNTPDGKSISLSLFKGKIVMVDFWASWCKPCREENPFVVSLYNKYKDKGFDIFSVSIDHDKNAWMEAIKKDNLIWKNHVSDVSGWQSPVVKLYGFSGIPFTVLLDKEGNIAAKNIRGPELEEKIKELLVISN